MAVLTLRIGVDLDEVVYPFVDVFALWVHETTGRPLEELGTAQRWEFYEDWGYPLDEFLRLFAAGVDAGFVFRKGLPAPGALDALHTLKRAGHSLHVVTDRSIGSCAQASTEAWLQEHKVPYDSITYAADKTIVRTDVFVDDKPENVLALREVGCAAFMWDNGRKDQAEFPVEWTVRSWGEFVEQAEAHEPQYGGRY